MIEGFVEVKIRQFSEIWFRINSKVVAVESNWARGKEGERPIIVKWGYTHVATGEKVILAVSRSDDDGDQYWVDPSLVESSDKVRRDVK